MSIGKILKLVFDQSMQRRKIQIASLNSQSIVHRKKAFYGKNNNFEMFTIFTGIFYNHALTFKLPLTSHLTFKK